MTIRALLPLAALLALAAPAAAAPPAVGEAALATAAGLRDAALAGSAAYDIAEDLTTRIGPRLAGTEADARAVQWAIDKFQALGYDRVWTEPVTFPVWTRGMESARVVSPWPQSLAIAALGGSIGTPEEGIQAEIVAFDSYADLLEGDAAAVEGKIVYIGNRMRRARDGRGYGEAVIARSRGASHAAKLGARAILIRSIGTAANSRTPHTGMLSYDIAFRKIPGAALSNPDADLIEAMLRRGEPVVVELRLGAGIRGEYTSQNVIAEVDGREESDRFVLIGGHLDSWDLGTGALDNGAGIGITMATGAMIAKLPKAQRPRHGVRVVAFANEEQGVHGGRAYAQAHGDALERHLIGAESDFGAGRIWRFDTRVPEAMLPLMEVVAEQLAPLGIERGGNEARGGADLSAMRELGMPLAGLLQDGSAYFDHHHTANDTLDKIDRADIAQNTAAYVTLVYLVAEHGAPAP